jgi:thioredoxin-like negative regulator of GroEL
VKRQQLILTGSSVLFVALLFFFGKTVPPRKQTSVSAAIAQGSVKFNFDSSLSAAKSTLTSEQQGYIKKLESAVVRGDVKNQQIHIFHQLASFWKDTANSFIPFAFYTAEASKLENSEKSLTFAAQLFLDNLRGVNDPSEKSWMAEQAKLLFERSLKLNPANDSAKIGLGSCFIFGSSADDPQQVMQGIQQILEVARRDPENMYAQQMLGIGGLVSGQVDKAIERLSTVVNHQPSNIEAILTLAEAYERKGDKTNAHKWYEASKKYIKNPEVLKEIDARIQVLK